MTTYYDQPLSPGSASARRLTNRNTNRYSVNHYFSMAAEQDMEVQDELARGTCRLVTMHRPWRSLVSCGLTLICDLDSPKAIARSEGTHICAVEEEFCFGA